MVQEQLLTPAIINSKNNFNTDINILDKNIQNDKYYINIYIHVRARACV